MADALCGPSNPLQSLQKQTSADRSLQRDRVSSLQRPSQGFRSSGPNAGVLDPEFDSFQASQIPLTSPENHGFNQAAFQHSQGLQQNGQLHQSAHWVGDFSNLNLSGPSASLVHPTAVPHQHSSRHGHSGAWQAEFQRQSSQISNRGQVHQDPHLTGQAFGTAWTPQIGMGAPLMNFQNQQVQHHQGQDQDQAATDLFGKEEWDKLFEEFEEEESMQEPAADMEVQPSLRAPEEETEEQSILENFDFDRFLNTVDEANRTDHLQETQRLGADLIIDPITDQPREQRPSRDPLEDNEALARTAGHLLESVSDNPNPKFQNSQFLRLMQQFRDREVAVKGDKIVGNVMGGSEEMNEQTTQMVAEVGVVSS